MDGIRVEARGRGREQRHLVHQLRTKMGMVFQAFNLFPHMTALENVMEGPLTVQGISKEAAAALAVKPRVMMFDEPTSALDRELIGEALGVMRELANEGMTMLTVTHEMSFARGAADRIVFMDAGRVVEVGPPAQLFDDPQDERTRDFLRAFNRMERRGRE